ncbi:MAG: hypothetical protein ACJ760_04685 [Thermoleophilaceae bacterium]
MPERASASRSEKPIFFLGHPSARAIGSHIAIASGVRTIDRFVAGA